MSVTSFLLNLLNDNHKSIKCVQEQWAFFIRLYFLQTWMFILHYYISYVHNMPSKHWREHWCKDEKVLFQLGVNQRFVDCPGSASLFTLFTRSCPVNQFSHLSVKSLQGYLISPEPLTSWDLLWWIPSWLSSSGQSCSCYIYISLIEWCSLRCIYAPCVCLHSSVVMYAPCVCSH